MNIFNNYGKIETTLFYLVSSKLIILINSYYNKVGKVLTIYRYLISKYLIKAYDSFLNVNTILKNNIYCNILLSNLFLIFKVVNIIMFKNLINNYNACVIISPNNKSLFSPRKFLVSNGFILDKKILRPSIFIYG